jgi:hypothetical protein
LSVKIREMAIDGYCQPAYQLILFKLLQSVLATWFACYGCLLLSWNTRLPELWFLTV